MTNQEQAITDGDFYLSRCRVNRHVVSITAGETATVRLNGKISKVIIDATDSAYLMGSGNIGQFQLFMDVEDGDGSELPYCDQITGLNYSGSGQIKLSALKFPKVQTKELQTQIAGCTSQSPHHQPPQAAAGLLTNPHRGTALFAAKFD